MEEDMIKWYWKCPTCGCHNSATQEECSHCQHVMTIDKYKSSLKELIDE